MDMTQSSAGLKIGPLTITTSRPAKDPKTGEPNEPQKIDAVTVNKLYDFVRNTISTTVSADVPPEVFPGGVASVNSRVAGLFCTERSRTATETDGLFEVGLNVVAKLQFTLCDAGGKVVERLSRVACFDLPTFLMFAPVGTRITVELEESRSTCTLPQNGEIFCHLHLGVLIESSASVRMLVPTFGFALPRGVTKASEQIQTASEARRRSSGRQLGKCGRSSRSQSKGNKGSPDLYEKKGTPSTPSGHSRQT